MSWNQSTDDEIGHYVAKNNQNTSAHLPFLTVYDRNRLMTLRYLQARVERESAVQLNELLWKNAWKQASSFPKSELSYRAWLLEVADQIISQPRNESKRPPDSKESLDAKQVATIEQALLKLSADRRKVFCMRAKGSSEQEVFAALGIDKTRGDHWFALAGTQLESILGAAP